MAGPELVIQSLESRIETAKRELEAEEQPSILLSIAGTTNPKELFSDSRIMSEARINYDEEVYIPTVRPSTQMPEDLTISRGTGDGELTTYPLPSGTPIPRDGSFIVLPNISNTPIPSTSISPSRVSPPPRDISRLGEEHKEEHLTQKTLLVEALKRVRQKSRTVEVLGNNEEIGDVIAGTGNIKLSGNWYEWPAYLEITKRLFGLIVGNLIAMVGYLPPYKAGMEMNLANKSIEKMGKKLHERHRNFAATSRGGPESLEGTMGITRRWVGIYRLYKSKIGLQKHSQQYYKPNEDSNGLNPPDLSSVSVRRQREYLKAIVSMIDIIRNHISGKFNEFSKESIQEKNEILMKQILDIYNRIDSDSNNKPKGAKLKEPIRELYSNYVLPLIKGNVIDDNIFDEEILGLKFRLKRAESEFKKKIKNESNKYAFMQYEGKLVQCKKIIDELEQGSVSEIIKALINDKEGFSRLIKVNFIGEYINFIKILYAADRLHAEFWRLDKSVPIRIQQRNISKEMNHKIFDGIVSSISTLSSGFTLAMCIPAIGSLIMLAFPGHVDFFQWFTEWSWSLCIGTFFLSSIASLSFYLVYLFKRYKAKEFYRKSELERACLWEIYSEFSDKCELFGQVKNGLEPEEKNLWNEEKKKIFKEYASIEAQNKPETDFCHGKLLQNYKDKYQQWFFKEVKKYIESFERGDVHTAMLKEVKKAEKSSNKVESFIKNVKIGKANRAYQPSRINACQHLYNQIAEIEKKIVEENLDQKLKEDVLIKTRIEVMSKLRKDNQNRARIISAELRNFKTQIAKNPDEYIKKFDEIIGKDPSKKDQLVKKYAIHRRYLLRIKENISQKKNEDIKVKAQFSSIAKSLKEAFSKSEIYYLPMGYTRDRLHKRLNFLLKCDRYDAIHHIGKMLKEHYNEINLDEAGIRKLLSQLDRLIFEEMQDEKKNLSVLNKSKENDEKISERKSEIDKRMTSLNEKRMYFIKLDKEPANAQSKKDLQSNIEYLNELRSDLLNKKKEGIENRNKYKMLERVVTGLDNLIEEIRKPEMEDTEKINSLVESLAMLLGANNNIITNTLEVVKHYFAENKNYVEYMMYLLNNIFQMSKNSQLHDKINKEQVLILLNEMKIETLNFQLCKGKASLPNEKEVLQISNIINMTVPLQAVFKHTPGETEYYIRELLYDSTKDYDQQIEEAKKPIVIEEAKKRESEENVLPDAQLKETIADKHGKEPISEGSSSMSQEISDIIEPEEEEFSSSESETRSGSSMSVESIMSIDMGDLTKESTIQQKKIHARYPDEKICQSLYDAIMNMRPKLI